MKKNIKDYLKLELRCILRCKYFITSWAAHLGSRKRRLNWKIVKLLIKKGKLRML